MLTSTLRRLLGGKRDEEEATRSPFQATRPFAGAQRLPASDLIFRLKSWPQLPEEGRTAEIYRMLSIMSSQPVNRGWLLARCRMAPHQLDRLLLKLVAQGALEVIDPGRFGRIEAGA
ncbi:MAG: hypothetical protein KGL68_02545 [Burkholderiales bacterium]|nr:hypothetical protein [Burkholderiales bacterium]